MDICSEIEWYKGNINLRLSLIPLCLSTLATFLYPCLFVDCKCQPISLSLSIWYITICISNNSYFSSPELIEALLNEFPCFLLCSS